MIEIVPFRAEAHWKSVWRFMGPVFQAGESYPLAPDISEKDARDYWEQVDKTTFVAIGANDEVLGIYYIRDNQPSLGAHICNCGYVVAPEARGQGVASKMCEHSQDFARSQGYRGMQFNLVVASNEGAVRLWKRHGYEIIATIPEGFRHKRLGFVDAYIMFKKLG